MADGFILGKEIIENKKDIEAFLIFNNLSNEEKKEKLKKIDDIRKKLEKLHSKKKELKLTTKKKGDLLEDYISLVLDLNNELIEYSRNIRTSDNEIDFLVKLSTLGRIMRDKKIISEYIPDSFPFECKNYMEKLEITYVNKFHSMLTLKKYPIGVLVSYNGITGDNTKAWQASLGLIKKINLLSFHTTDFSLICYADKERLEYLEENEYNFFRWLDRLREETKIDVFEGF